jgi:SanA protein
MRGKRILYLFLTSIAVAITLILWCNWKVESAAKGKLYSDINKVPHRHVGLLLGTSKYVRRGWVNQYYSNRIEAAAELCRRGTVDYLIVSGDNGQKEYNEPGMMLADLMKAGVDSTSVYLDYAGFRTFDSMIRLRKIFSQDSVVIISQKFHNERALYIAQQEGISAIAYSATDVSQSMGFKTQLREKLARVKMFGDYVFNTSPRFLGPKVTIP